MEEEVDLKGKGLFYQNMSAALAVVIDNSEAGELKKHSSGFSLYFKIFCFFFKWAYSAKCSSENDNKSPIPGMNCFYKP